MTDTERLTIYIYGGDWDLEEEMEEKGGAGLYVAATTLVSGTGALVATLGATTAIHATLTGALSARGTDTNRYYVTLQGEDIEANLLTSWKQTIYKYVTFGNDYKRWHPVFVEKYRH